MTERESGSNAGVIAMLVIIAILLVGGFLYFTGNGFRGDDGPDIELEVDAPDTGGGGEGGGGNAAAV